MGAFSSIVYTREQAIDQLVRCKIEHQSTTLRRQVSSMTNDEIEGELSRFLAASLYNAVIEDE